jgi:predicted TIM-barrel fold metal-dependent hydrolase
MKSQSVRKRPMLRPHMPSIRDAEGLTVPPGLPPVVDAHVHVFPHTIFSAIWGWFNANAWRIRYQLRTSDVFSFLLSRGLAHIIALQYAHKPGISEKLNRYLARKCQDHHGRITGLATVFPGEDGADRILQNAFDSGLSGLKLHAHVQCFDMNSEAMDALYDLCQSNQKPIVMHVGREPRSDEYRCDPYQICSVDKLERVLVDYPKLKVCVPHLGFDEVSDYRELIEKYDTLWLDTTMVLTDYFPIGETVDLKRYRSDRIMYGSDFPNIPYAWDRELKWLSKSGLSCGDLEKILNKSASHFFNLKRIT